MTDAEIEGFLHLLSLRVVKGSETMQCDFKSILYLKQLRTLITNDEQVQKLLTYLINSIDHAYRSSRLEQMNKFFQLLMDSKASKIVKPLSYHRDLYFQVVYLRMITSEETVHNLLNLINRYIMTKKDLSKSLQVKNTQAYFTKSSQIFAELCYQIFLAASWNDQYYEQLK